MSERSASIQNLLLLALPQSSLASLLPKLTPVSLEAREEIYPPGGRMTAVCFPQSGMISLVALLEDGTRAEVGLIGREGMLGISLLSGAETSYAECTVQLAGSALRMSASDFGAELDRNKPLGLVLLRYYEALQAQVMQTAACNGRHGLEQRLARWLLMAHDRAGAAELPLTQEYLAMMLGVHRPSITLTAGILQRAGLIKYSNGRVTVLDRAGLEAASCECYGAVRARFADLLGAPASRAYET